MCPKFFNRLVGRAMAPADTNDCTAGKEMDNDGEAGRRPGGIWRSPEAQKVAEPYLGLRSSVVLSHQCW